MSRRSCLKTLGLDELHTKPSDNMASFTTLCQTAGASQVPYIAFRSLPNRPGTQLFGSSAGSLLCTGLWISPCKEARFTSNTINLFPCCCPADAHKEANSLVASNGGVPAKSSLCSSLASSCAHNRLRCSSRPLSQSTQVVPINLAGSAWNFFCPRLLHHFGIQCQTSSVVHVVHKEVRVVTSIAPVCVTHLVQLSDQEQLLLHHHIRSTKSSFV